MIDIVKIASIITDANPNLELAKVEQEGNNITITALINNEYYEICKIDEKAKSITVNKFTELYDDIYIDLDKLKECCGFK